MKNRFLLWSLVGGILFLIVGSLIWSASRKKDEPVVIKPGLAVISPTDNVKGSKDAKIVLVEYSDFQCPACGTYYPLVKQIALDYKDSIAVVSRNFPLRSNHKNAQMASQAAEAAGKQGKYWEMHDFLFERQEKWSELSEVKEIFKGYAKELKLDVKKFEADLTSKAVEQKVEADYQSGIQAQVNSTPTFFLNGKKVSPRSYQDFRTLIEDSLKEQK